ncbi:cytochrome b-c1 complex subunit 7-2 [Dorcoceras hygrometricum]|uniref:Cytochrome b-c1 complex subunit 7-2 n=1 Tax=Dorcoceras hygrometricum TaxID=472368 RepID=A0A2Z7DAK9_9LAMI|nr:cytochrome b-c1 complex subunit 7-2 [Dorcoceras hygrometricum]
MKVSEDTKEEERRRRIAEKKRRVATEEEADKKKKRRITAEGSHSKRKVEASISITFRSGDTSEIIERSLDIIRALDKVPGKGVRVTNHKLKLLQYNSVSFTPEDSQALKRVFTPAEKARLKLSKRLNLVKPISTVSELLADLPLPVEEEPSKREKSPEIFEWKITSEEYNH